MSSLYTGRCLCGAVTFSLSEAPAATRACWCRDCQYLCSGNASLSTFFRRRALTVAGETAEFISSAASGNSIRRQFCPKCGTPLFSEDLSEQEYFVVRLGALDDREQGAPHSTIWTASAPSWATFDKRQPLHLQQPDGELGHSEA
jgi:hypothetical protein